ncbi:MAG: exopolysaccharide biosynthesis protein [Rhizobiaceae bacterium]
MHDQISDAKLQTEEEAPVLERLSALLLRLARRDRETLAIGDITRTLRDRGFSASLFLLCAPNLIPAPPGTSTIFGLPMIFVAVQLMLGYRRPVLPGFIRHKQIGMVKLRTVISRIVPWIERFEKIARPRYWFLPHRAVEIATGVMAIVMGIILILPLPFANFVPAAAIAAASLGLGERDGLWFALGVVFSVLSLGIVIGVIATAGLAVTGIF